MTRKRRQIKQFHKKMMSLVLLSSLTLSNFSGVIYAEDLLEDPELDITQEELYEELQEELFEETENEFLGEEREESEEGLAGEEEAGSEEESEEVEDDADSDDVKEKSDSKPSHHVESSGAVDGKGKKMRDITLIDDGISLMSSFVMLTSESGGFSDWEAGRYAVPVSVLNISNTAIAELADSAIGDGVDDEYDYGDRSAVLVIDDSGNATLTLTLETFERNGYGSTLSENLTTRDSYISDVKYYTTSDGGETYVSASATESKTDGGIVTEIQIPITDKTVDGMYINYEQKSVEGGYVLAAVNAYLEIDYAVQKVLPAPVYYFGQNNIPFEEGSHNIPVTIKSTTGGDFNANNTLSDMTANDDFTNAIFTVDSNGNASLTMKFTYSKGSSWGKTTYLGTENIWYYASDELSTNTSTADLTLSTLATDRTSDTSTGKTFINEVTIPIETNYTVSGGDGIFIYCIYFNSGSSSSRGNAFLQIDYDHCAPEPEYSDDDYAKRYTVGSERTMFGMGTYDIKAYFKKAGEEDEDSMASAALKEDAQLLVDVDGNVTVLLEFQQATIMGFAGNGNNFKYFTTYPDGDEIAATVLTTSGGYPRKILVGHDDVHVDGVYVSMEIKTSLMDMDQTGYMLLDLSGVGEPYNPTTVTLRDGEDYWDSSGDFVAPTIAIDGYFHGSTVEIEQGAKLEAFTVPTATVTDNVDTGLTATEYYYTVNEYDDAADALAALAAVKAYLAEAVGNQVRIYYRATDAAGNQGYTYITLVSIEEDLNEYEDVTQNGTYGVSVELLKEYEDNASMGDPAFDGHRTAKVTTENGVYTVEIGVGTITMMGLTSGIENITSEDGKMTDIAEETTTLPDGTVYTSKFTFKTTSLESTYLMGFGIAGMDMAQKARLALDWDKATVYDENGNGGEEGEGEGEGEGQEPEEPEEPELDTDETAPVLSITGYSDGDAITVSMAAIDVLTLPVVTATDEVDGDVSVTTVISNDIIEFLDFDFAKVFLKATAGNSVKVTYTATDAAGNEANATIAFTSKENPSNDGLLKDNTSYGVPVRLLKEYEDNASMGDSAFDGFRTAKVTNRGGVYTVEVNVGTVTFGGTLTSGLINVKSEDGTIFNIKEEYSTLSDGIVYTSKFTFTTTELLDTYAITFDIAEMDMTHAARLELDWEKAEEIGGAEALYFTFGTAKTMLYNGTHGMTVKVSNPADNTKTSLLTSAISTASTMTVDGNGGGKVTLRFADVTLDGTSHTPQDFMYYTSSDLSPASLVEADFVSATEAEFVISDPTIDGIYISTALGDSFVTASAYVELEYVRCMTGVAYDAEKVTERVEIVPPTGDDDTNTDTDADTNTDADTDTDTEDNNNNNNNNNTNSDFADINVNGTYDVPVYLYKETGSELSMGDAAFANSRTSVVTNKDGEYTFVVSIGTLSYSGLVGGIANVASEDGDISDIKQEYSIDVNGERYVSTLFFTTDEIQDYYMISFDIPVMNSRFSAKLTFDWSNITKSTGDTIVYVYVEVEAPVVEEEAEEETTTGTTVATGTIADVTKNGQYLVPLTLMHEVNDQVSMGDPAFNNNRYAYVSTKDGVYTVTVSPSTITMGDLTSGIGLLVSEDGRMKDLKVLEYTKLSSGDSYISSFQFTTTQLDSQYAITMTIPNAPMGATGARLVLDWSNAQTTSKAFESGAVLCAETTLPELLENGENLVVANPSGLQVEFDEEALKSIIEQVGGAEITIVIDELSLEVQLDEEGNEIPLKLTTEQQEAIGERKAFSLQVLAGEKTVSHFGEGKVTVSIPYFLERVKAEEGLSVWHVDDDGTVKVFECGYEDYDRLVQFETTHFSIYTVEHDGSEVSAKSVIESLPFIDVTTADWFYDSVKFVYENEILSGATATSFDPNTQMTKAMLLTALYRMEGMPQVSGRNEFSDVLPNQYYSDAILWTTENGIAFGNGDGTFGVNVNVTREEMVHIIYNFGMATGMDMSVSADMADFLDHQEVDGYAVDPFAWALGNGIISGNGNQMLAPKNTARRSEVSTILMNLVSSK